MSRAIDALVLVHSLLSSPGSLSGAGAGGKVGSLLLSFLCHLVQGGRGCGRFHFLEHRPYCIARSLAAHATAWHLPSLPSTEDIVVLWPTGQHLPRHCHKPRNRVCRHACTHRIMVGAGFRLVAKMARVKKKKKTINVHTKRQRMQTVSTGAASRCWATMEEHSDMIAT